MIAFSDIIKNKHSTHDDLYVFATIKNSYVGGVQTGHNLCKGCPYCGAGRIESDLQVTYHWVWIMYECGTTIAMHGSELLGTSAPRPLCQMSVSEDII